MLHLGLLITKDDDEIIEEWLFANHGFFDAIACLDGSTSDFTRVATSRYSNVRYLHERDALLDSRTDHGLRAPVHDVLVREFGLDCWITLCHADEFFYHNPRRCCERAEREGATVIESYALHFLPHPNDLAQWQAIRHLPTVERFRYYHWDFNGTGLPWIEVRSYRNGPDVRWDKSLHGSTQPFGCDRPASFRPAYRHYKVYSVDAGQYQIEGNCTRFRHRWNHLASGRSGVPWIVQRPEDLFVAQFRPYLRCDYFQGVFPYSWNMGDEFR